MTGPRTLVTAMVSLVAVTLGLSWLMARELNEEVHEFAGMAEALGVPTEEAAWHLLDSARD